jgi:hypothetical protein
MDKYSKESILSMTQLTLQDSLLHLINTALADSSGEYKHTGDYTIEGTTTVSILNADTINVKNLVTESGALADIGNWTVNTEDELVGKGFVWAYGNGATQLQYRSNGRLWTNASIDLEAGKSFKIDDVTVLSESSLGDTVVNSKLRSIGTLNSLRVSGDSTLGDFLYVNSTFNRLGIGTEDPSSAITIFDNNVIIDLGSPDYDLGSVGTASNHDFSIVTDSLARITAKANGEVHIGNPISKDGLLRVYGSLYVDNLVADTRVDRTSPLEFRATRDQNIYGLGLVWSGQGPQRELMMYSNPDRLRTTENFEVAEGQAYFIGNNPVLTQHRLGNTVLHSNLSTVGPLQSLTVQGTTTLENDLTVHGVSTFETIMLTDGTQNIIIDKKGIGSFNAITLSSAGYEAVYADANEINIGDRGNSSRVVKVFGPLSIGITNPDSNLQFAVNGDVSIGGKHFTNGTQAPNTGTWSQGDICWNTQPLPSSYIGWTCVQSGSPGTWLGFGMIASQ